MLRVVLLCALASVALCRDPELDEHWLHFTAKFNKDARNVLRRAVFEDNIRKIRDHNLRADLGLHSYRLGLNKYADMSNQEFRRMMNGYRSISRKNTNSQDLPPFNLPKSVDWRTKGYVTGIKDQGQCGSCWAFSATGSVEAAHFNATGKLVSLSEQNLVDCSSDEGNDGCGGGLMDQAFQYIIKNGGIDTEKSYPYTAEDGTCHFKANAVGAKISSFVDVKSGSESALQKAVATVGPISVGIDASSFSFQLYTDGVYDEPDCSSTLLDHGVLAVGYDTTSDGVDYWIVKNSWGDSWGQKGYIWMSRNKDNQCGIATDASYPVV